MFPFLKKHPFAVEAFFDYSLVLTFAIPKEELQYLIPECLELDTLNDQFAFIAIAMVQTKDLRPEGFPKIIGNDFFLIGYRIFVRYKSTSGKRLRGLYIIKSQTDKKKMELLGNLFTHYGYTTTDIRHSKQENEIHVASSQSPFSVRAGLSDGTIPLPEHSPFLDWKEARRFAGPLPFTFTWLPETSEVLIIEGVRQNWEPKPIKVLDYHFPFLDSLHLKNVVLANAFIIHDIPYYWKKGRTEKWTK